MSPYNFIYFLSLFTIAIIGGVYLLFSYKKNYLTLLNAFLFLLCAVRIFTEYYIHQIDDYEVVVQLAAYHSYTVPLIFAVLGTCVWFFIRPIKHLVNEKQINQLITIFLVLLPSLLTIIALYQNNVYRFNPEKIEGLWKYTIDVENSYFLQIIPYYVIGMAVGLLFLLFFSIWQHPKDRLKKILLCLAFPIIPALYVNVTDQSTTWIIPNSGTIYLAHSILITWFLTDYRLLSKGNYDLTTDVVNSISDLVIITSPSLEIKNVNNAANEFFKPTDNLLYNLLVQNSDYSRLEILNILQPLLKNEAEKISLSLKGRQNTFRDFELKMTPFKKGATSIGYTLLLTDLTEIKTKERELERLNEFNQHIFSIISHDLRKPALSLRKITEKITYLIEKEDYNTLREFSLSIKKSTTTLTNLINNLLNWALNEKGVLFNNPAPISIRAVTEEVIRSYDQYLNKKQINTLVTIPNKLYAFVDRTACLSIFSNLLDNAIKFTPEGGEINIEAFRQDSRIIVTIEDSGEGINEQKLNQIFTLSKNKSEVGTNQETGSGLGLYLVKNLMDANQSSIQLENKEGSGLKVILTFPIAHKLMTKFPAAISA